jgi:hypothetical protein
MRFSSFVAYVKISLYNVLVDSYHASCINASKDYLNGALPNHVFWRKFLFSHRHWAWNLLSCWFHRVSLWKKIMKETCLLAIHEGELFFFGQWFCLKLVCNQERLHWERKCSQPNWYESTELVLCRTFCWVLWWLSAWPTGPVISMQYHIRRE